jgi:dUTP pyrophosphatase
MLKVPLQVLSHGEGLELPAYATALSAGVDLRAAVTETLALAPLQRALVPTGLSLALPAGYEAQIRPRSGLALKHGLTCLNSPGTIDADYRGEVKVLLINLGQEVFNIARGERIAQMIVSPVVQVAFETRESLDETARGAGGFGHSGVK